jgi:Copper transport outer membrane protein, MctB
VVTFRFHLLSLTAVFMALAVGIAIGATVVDQKTVDALQGRLNTVERNVERTNKRNNELESEISQWNRFSEQAADELVEGRLSQQPVLVVAVRGIDTEPVDRFRQSLSRAGALLEGTIWFTSKLKLEKADEVAALAEILGVPGNRPPDELRLAMVSRLAASWSGSGELNPLPALIKEAFAEFERPQGIDVNPATVPRVLTKFVVVSDEGADVANELFAIPFATQLATRFPSRVLAAEALATATFVGPLRQGEASNLLSTVDNMADFKGRMAGVMAVQDLAREKVGHYGLGPRASRLVPEPAS